MRNLLLKTHITTFIDVIFNWSGTFLEFLWLDTHILKVRQIVTAKYLLRQYWPQWNISQLCNKKGLWPLDFIFISLKMAQSVGWPCQTENDAYYYMHTLEKWPWPFFLHHLAFAHLDPHGAPLQKMDSAHYLKIS